MKLKKHWRVVCRVVATLLLLVGLSFGYWWFYKLAPLRRTLSPEWRSSHSQREYWREAQKAIHRGMWWHDAGFVVGWYGDKSWAEWIMTNVTPGTSMDCMGRLCHSASAMRYITNQDVGDDADAWLDWWARNRSKSRNEWIADGFRQRGIEIDVPPSPDQMSVLLGLLGKSEANGSPVVIEQTKYNAFRCLRDSDFDPVAYALSERPFPADVELGLLEYARLERRWPTADGVGVLSFGKTDDKCEDYESSTMLTPIFQSAAHLLVVVPLVLGAGLLAWSFRRRSRVLDTF